jgi:outer membrane receptor protein involved in Fe transport
MEYARLRIALPFTAVLLLGAATCFADEEPVPKFVVARASGSATVLYDATKQVSEIVRDKLDDEAADRRLQHEALRVLASVTPELPDAQTITIRITYAQSGEVSPVYGTPTFAGIERYANMSASAVDAKSDRDRWKEGVPGALPSWISFTVVGKLPPR